jgi:hypothetical protein
MRQFQVLAARFQVSMKGNQRAAKGKNLKKATMLHAAIGLLP